MAGSSSPGPDFAVQVDEPSRWQGVLSSVGLKATREPARFRIFVGDSPAAREAGVEPTTQTIRVASVVEARNPTLRIVWQEPLEVPVYSLPDAARVFVREKWTGTPLLAGLPRQDSVLFWAAADPGPRGYERFPYLIQALTDLGLTLPFRTARTWAFFDYSYRARVDLAYLARRWRDAGIAALHVSAWHFYDPGPQQEHYLEQLIEACHREGVLVYAWLELPHVSEAFWDANPICREKTAVLQDAHLDWRKLINLADPACFERAAQGLGRLLERFDWDGVNLAELYFESLHGPANPQRFTPLNDWVRADYRKRAGFDPLELFDPKSVRFWSQAPSAWSQFADYRADLALRLQLGAIEAIRASAPELDIVVTQIDDLFDTRMREFLGAHTAALLPLAEKHDFRLVIEDPATLWDLGPERYREIARRYRPLAPDPERLAIDLNIVERYQETYPTKKQVGVELFQLLRQAGQSFPRVLFYAEHSISRPDVPLLPFAAADAEAEWRDGTLVVEANRPVGVTWPDALLVNGQPWPVTNGAVAWLPAGQHTLSRGAASLQGCQPIGDCHKQVPHESSTAHGSGEAGLAVTGGPSRTVPLRILYLNGDLESARATRNSVDFQYHSSSRAIALVDRQPGQIQLDGTQIEPPILETETHRAIMLPRGRHAVRITQGGLLP